MATIEAENLGNEGNEALKKGAFKKALECFERLVILERTPAVCSSLAFCLAREKGAYKEAIALSNEAIRKDPKDVRHFLLLGRIYVLAGRKKEALRTFNLGLRHGVSPEIETELRNLGMRRPPVLPFLGRDNAFNKFLGKLLARWGYR